MKILSRSNNNKVLLLLRHRHRQLSTHTKGYKGIGSFHSENVDMLMEQSDDDYIIPQLPFEPKKKSSHNLNKGEKDQYAGDDFLLDRKKWTFLNHGAFGAALKVGYDRAEQWRFVLSCVLCVRIYHYFMFILSIYNKVYDSIVIILE